MPRITTQKEAAKSIKKVKQAGFCYICGCKVHRAEGKGVTWDEDHVLPNSLLREADCQGTENWPVKLPVHRTCHEEKKGLSEDQLLDFIRIQIDQTPLTDPRTAGRIKKIVEQASFTPISSDFVAVEGLGEILLLPRIWVRGLLSVVYGKVFLSQWLEHCYPPIPVFLGSPDSSISGIARTNGLKEALSKAMQLGVRLDCWDGLVSHGGEVSFSVVWTRFRRGSSLKVEGIWMLKTPLSDEWCKAVGAGSLVWQGLVQPPHPPRGIKRIDQLLYRL